MYENGKLIIHKEYFNGKKSGNWFCLNDEASKCETKYKNGKKIKDCK
jgi:antitoxin component YwqK of YwqJK toxin-antitoxin module